MPILIRPVSLITAASRRVAAGGRCVVSLDGRDGLAP
jgi:hypothetical protein